MKVFVRIPPVGDCGVGYYRQWLPIETARKHGALEYECLHFSWGTNKKDPPCTDKDLYRVGEETDIFYFSRNDVPEYIAQAGGMREFFKKPIVLDIDDNVHGTRPYNPGYRSFHPNSPHNVWNIKSLGIYDGITVSTQDLVDFYTQYTEKDKIFLCPNSLEWKERDMYLNFEYPNSKLFKKKKNEIRIGWTGSAAHWENLKHIEEPITQILKKYPQATFYYTGIFGDLFQDKSIAKQIKKVPFAKLKEWAKFNREVNFDIAVAPLMDNIFNRAKSNLRILEYASAKFPVICSPIKPYQEFKDHREILFAMEKNEWFDAIEELILNPDLRKELADNLHKTAKDKYDIDKNYKIWVKALKEIKDRFDKAHKQS